jgi:hypothetical protein
VLSTRPSGQYKQTYAVSTTDPDHDVCRIVVLTNTLDDDGYLFNGIEVCIRGDMRDWVDNLYSAEWLSPTSFALTMPREVAAYVQDYDNHTEVLEVLGKDIESATAAHNTYRHQIVSGAVDRTKSYLFRLQGTNLPMGSMPRFSRKFVSEKDNSIAGFAIPVDSDSFDIKGEDLVRTNDWIYFRLAFEEEGQRRSELKRSAPERSRADEAAELLQKMQLLKQRRQGGGPTPMNTTSGGGGA